MKNIQLIFLIAPLCLAFGCRPSNQTEPTMQPGAGPTDTRSSDHSSPTPSENPSAVASLSSVSQVRIVKKDGKIVEVDYRPCGDGWTKSLSAIAELPFVETLSMAGPELTDETLTPLAGHPGLRRISVEQSRVTDTGIAMLAKLPRLEDINLDRPT